MDRLIGIIRSDAGLVAKLVRQNVALNFESCENVTQAGTETNPWYEIVEKPLEQLEAGLFPNQERLLNAWQRLAQVREQTPKVLSALQTVLTETVLGVPVTCPAPLRTQTGERTVKPTAAHPRAFQGTTYKLPSKKMPVSANLRPLLSSTRRLGLVSEAEEERLATETRLPALFRTSLYWMVRRQFEGDVSDALALYWGGTEGAN